MINLLLGLVKGRGLQIATGLGLVALLVAAVLGVYHYGEARYVEGVQHQKGIQAQEVVKQTDTLSTDLVKAQDETLKTLRAERDIAITKQAEADARATQLQATIVGLQHVKENNCISVNPDTVLMLNRGACAYNVEHNLSTSTGQRDPCAQGTATGPQPNRVPGNPVN